MEIQPQDLINEIAAQRDQAFNALAQAGATIAALKRRIAELEGQVAGFTLTAEMAKPMKSLEAVV